MKTFNFLSIATIAAALFISNIHAADANQRTAEEFVQKASMGNQFEIEAGNLAKERSQNENVKQFAERIITDHNNVATELESAVASANLDTSLIARTLDKKHSDKLAKLQKASAKDFDKKYLDSQEDAHKDAVKLFKDYSEKGTNTALKSFAGKHLPTLEDHHKQAKDLESSL